MEEIKEVLSNENTPVTPTPVPILKPRNKPVPVRSISELDEVAVKKMTDKEKEIYIESLRKAVQEICNINNQWETQAKSAFEKSRVAEEEINKIRNSANLKLKLVEDNVRVMANNIMTILK